MRLIKVLMYFLLFFFLAGFFIPNQHTIPVEGADEDDWNHQTFWRWPWGTAVHKGIDIFAYDDKTPALAATHGIVIEVTHTKMGGNIIKILGPKWRLHYYAHLNKIDVKAGVWVKVGEQIGIVGNTGNAAGRQPHLHYSIQTLIPYLWRWSSEREGWKKIFYLNPHDKIIIIAEKQTKQRIENAIIQLEEETPALESLQYLLKKKSKSVLQIINHIHKIPSKIPKDRIIFLRNGFILLSKIGGNQVRQELSEWSLRKELPLQVHASVLLALKLIDHPKTTETEYPDLYQKAFHD